jgi:TolA-binding protein
MAEFYSTMPAENEEQREGNRTKAISYYRQAYNLSHKPFYLYQAALLLRLGNKDEAHQLFADIILQHPSSTYANLSRKCL